MDSAYSEYLWWLQRYQGLVHDLQKALKKVKPDLVWIDSLNSQVSTAESTIRRLELSDETVLKYWNLYKKESAVKLRESINRLEKQRQSLGADLFIIADQSRMLLYIEDMKLRYDQIQMRIKSIPKRSLWRFVPRIFMRWRKK